LPNYHLTILHKRKLNPTGWICTQAIPNEIHTIGDHIKKNRLKRRQFQYELAERFGVTLDTIRNWEQNRFPPHERTIPAIIAWLGYDPRT